MLEANVTPAQRPQLALAQAGESRDNVTGNSASWPPAPLALQPPGTNVSPYDIDEAVLANVWSPFGEVTEAWRRSSNTRRHP